MKRVVILLGILMLLPSIFAATYYVDATDGSDSNDGLTTGNAWKTISKVNGMTFAPGDKIFFQRGETWREKLVIPSSGAAGNPITFGAYGSGAKPRILASEDISTSSHQWTSSGSGTNEYYLQAAGGGNPGISQTYLVILDNSRMKEGSIGSLGDHQWVWGNNDGLGYNTVYIRDNSGDPDTTGVIIEASQRTQAILCNQSYINIQDIYLGGAGYNSFNGLYGHNLYIGVSDHVTASRLSIYHSTGSGVKIRSPPGDLMSQNILVTNSTVVGAGDTGISPGAYGSKNLTISYNDVSDCCWSDNRDWNAGIKVFGTNRQDIIIEHNNVHENLDNNTPNSGYGIWLDTVDDVIARYNHVWKNALAGIMVEDSAGTQIYSNVVHDNGQVYPKTAGIIIYRDGHNNSVYNNLVYNNNFSGITVKGGGPSTFPWIHENAMRGNVVRNNILIGNSISQLRASWGAQNPGMDQGDGYNGEGNIYTNNILYENGGWKAVTWDGYYDDTQVADWEATVNGVNNGIIENNLGLNPLLADFLGGNYSLLAGSPAIDAGFDVGLISDYSGVSIPQGLYPDIGPMEYLNNTQFSYNGSHGLPGRIEAEDYDLGGEGVSYHDTTTGNRGGFYRGDDVDIKLSNDSNGGYAIGWIAEGEWLEYTVDVGTTGYYDISFRVLSQVGTGQFHLEVDGVDVTGVQSVPMTGLWDSMNWTTLRVDNVSLTAGKHTMRFYVDSQFFDINYIDISSHQSPYNPPHNIPGRIEAEDYDLGGEGISYHDTDLGNTGGQYRSEDIDLKLSNDSNGGYAVGWLATGEWLEYTINVGTTGYYDISFRVLSQVGTGQFHLEVDGINVTGVQSVPMTGKWDSGDWKNIGVSQISLTAGTHVLKLVVDSQAFDINYMDISASSTPIGTPGGGGGGGGGAGSGTSATPSITESQTVPQTKPPASIIFTGFNPDLRIKQVEVKINSEVQNAGLAISKYDSRPEVIPVEKPGLVYRYLEFQEINIGDKLDKVIITFFVDKDWVDGNELKPTDVSFFRYENISENWKELKTSYNTSDDDYYYYYYEAESNDFGFFAIGEQNRSILEAKFGTTAFFLFIGGVIILAIIVLVIIKLIFKKRNQAYDAGTYPLAKK